MLEEVGMFTKAGAESRHTVHPFQPTNQAPGPDEGSIADVDEASRSDRIRPGAVVAWIFKREDGGERVKR